MTHVELFAGIGGISIAAEWAGFRTVAQVERDPYCLKVLEKHWPDVHRVKDIRDFPDQDYGAVTLVSGGFPCQPFSAAGKRRGKEDDRYLWPEMLRVIREIRPTWVLAENVPGILSIESGLLFESVLNDLEAEGYQTWTGLIPASGVGANHRRERVFIVAYSNSRRLPKSYFCQKQSERTKVISASQDVADTGRSGRIQQEESRWETGERNRNGGQDVPDHDGKIGQNIQGSGAYEGLDGGRQPCTYGWGDIESGMGDLADGFSTWMVEPDIPRVAKGVKDRVNKLRALGNAVVPQQVYPILQAIAEVER